MYQILLVSFLVVAVALVGLILVQHGKGADMGASFGAGASNTVFGSTGSGNFLTRSTAILATLFFSLALGLGYLTSHNTKPKGDDIGTAIEQKEQSTKVPDTKETSTPASPASEMTIPDVEVKKDATKQTGVVPDVKVEKKQPVKATADEPAKKKKQDEKSKDGSGR